MQNDQSEQNQEQRSQAEVVGLTMLPKGKTGDADGNHRKEVIQERVQNNQLIPRGHQQTVSDPSSSASVPVTVVNSSVVSAESIDVMQVAGGGNHPKK